MSANALNVQSTLETRFVAPGGRYLIHRVKTWSTGPTAKPKTDI